MDRNYSNDKLLISPWREFEEYDITEAIRSACDQYYKVCPWQAFEDMSLAEAVKITKSYSSYDLRQIHFIKGKLPNKEESTKRWKSMIGRGSHSRPKSEPDDFSKTSSLRR